MSRIALCSLSASLLFVPAIAAAQGRVVSVRRGVPQTTISGLVYDAELSTPLPLAEVFLLGPRARTEMVQGDGRFSKTGVQAGRYAVFVQARGYTSDTLQLQLEEGMAIDLDFGLRPAATEDRGAIAGSAVDATNGQAMGDVHVVIDGTDVEGYTSRDGRFVMRDVPPGRWKVRAESEWYEAEPARTIAVAADSVVRDIRFALRPAMATIIGVARDSADGRPVTGLTVELIGSSWPSYRRSTRTNARGVFRFDSIPRPMAPWPVLLFGGRHYRHRGDSVRLAKSAVTRHDVRLVNDSLRHLAMKVELERLMREDKKRRRAADSTNGANGRVDSVLAGWRKPDTAGVIAYQGLARRLLWTMVHARPDSNVVLSPVGAGMALSLAAQGARGATAAELARALGERVDSTLAGRNAALLDRARGRTDVTLEIANALWVDTSVSLAPGFSRVARDGFRAEARGVPLVAGGEGPRLINAWADSATHHRIPSVVSDPLPDSMRLVITNAVYFLGKWPEAFDSTRTRERDFAVSSSERRRVKMMERTGDYAYRRAQGYQLLRLPYRTGRTAMYVILPDSGVAIDSLQRALEASGWPRTATSAESRLVHVMLPRVHSELAFDLKPPLRALGLREALNCEDGTTADFSGMLVGRGGRPVPLCIGEARQATFLRIDEAGTEAAAVTAVLMEVALTGAPTPIEFVVDRPFLFLVRDEVSGAELFAGRIVRP